MSDEKPQWRQSWFNKRILSWYRKMLPPISATERDAIAAGTVWWDAELFSGRPDWSKLRGFAKPELSAQEQAFLDGPVEKLCAMLNDWEIRRRGDLPEEVWQFIRNKGFMGIIIPKENGGLGFSALAHSQIVMKIASRSPTAAVSMMVPNSLGPAELLLRYGTDVQRDYYLPRLADGREIPCFALTGPEAGSDAASIPDRGIVCYGEYKGERMLGMRVTWEKRYITLAPVATLMGLAFQVSDPDHLLGPTEELGITLALVPTATDGVEIGRRHFPAGQAFQNGPTRGTDVFFPMEWVIGGQERIGQGWRMLMDALTAGRAISLPALGTGAAIFCARNTGAYARIRRQFGLPIGRFEGVEEPLARIAATAYSLDAARRLTAAVLDAGEQPSVLSAILKYHSTERMRTVLNDAMDIHGGRGICDGPRNYLFGVYQSVPISITVEGANILTRNLMIFGQGVLRCHPHLLKEMEAANSDAPDAAQKFEKEFRAHIRGAISNVLRAFWHNLTFGIFAYSPDLPGIGVKYRQLHSSAVTFAAVADLVMATLGGALKRRESLSARLGDVLSELYLMSCVLKRFEDDGLPTEDYPLVEWNHRMGMVNIQKALDEILCNLPSRPTAWFLRVVAFPWGRHHRPPSMRTVHAVACLITAPSETRERLTQGIYVNRDPTDATGRIEVAFTAAITRDAIEEKIRKARGRARYTARDMAALVGEGVINQSEADALTKAKDLIRDAIDVDDFAPSELTSRTVPTPHSVAAKKTRATPSH